MVKVYGGILTTNNNYLRHNASRFLPFIEAGMLLDEKTCTRPIIVIPLYPEPKTGIMKTRTILLSILLIFFLQGCFVKSLHPFYTDDDIIFKKELIGNWTDKDSAAWEIRQHMRTTGLFKPDAPDKSYDISLTDNKGSSRFIAHLFRLEDQLYLDFLPTDVSCGNNLAGVHLIATHSLAKVDFSGGKISIGWYNEEWLIGLFNKNKIRIAHERLPYDPDQRNSESMQVILTARTEELQKFIIKYGNDPEAFKKEKPDSSSSDYTFVLSRK